MCHLLFDWFIGRLTSLNEIIMQCENHFDNNIVFGIQIKLSFFVVLEGLTIIFRDNTTNFWN